MKILAISDQEVPALYSPLILERFREIDLVVSCGDLSYSYLDYIHSMLNCRLCYVRGNHCRDEQSETGSISGPAGGIDLHRQMYREPESGLLLAGVQGSLSYNRGHNQYTQADMWWMVWGMVPALLVNKMRFGRFVDIFVSHSPPWKIHDKDDLPHRGIKAFRWLIKAFQPAYHLHGHIHVYRQDEVTETQVGPTRVINAYGFRLIDYHKI